MPKQVKQVTAANTSTPLLDFDAKRSGYELHNASDAIIYYSEDNGVSTTNGHAIGVGETHPYKKAWGDSVEGKLYCVSAAGGKIITVCEEYEPSP